MSPKRISYALTIAFVLHALIIGIGSVYLLNQIPRFKEFIEAKVLPPAPSPRRKRRPLVRFAVQPSVPLDRRHIGAADEHKQTRHITIRHPEQTLHPRTIVVFSSITTCTIGRYLPIYVPETLRPKIPPPSDTSHTDLFLPDAPNALVASKPMVTPATKRIVMSMHRRRNSIVKLYPDSGRPAGLSMVEHVGAVRDALTEVVEEITLGNEDIPPLPPGEPGGRVIGRGKDIRGVLRFTRVKHGLSDWWTNPSALNHFAKWANERTKIRTDLNVAGGTPKLTDANLMKAPLIFMTGHDPALVRSKNLMGSQYGGGKLDSKLSEAEIIALRKYLVEKGGFLIFDDCGVNAPAQAMTQTFLAQMRRAMPEYHIERVPNNHEIYHNFHTVGGPPIGFDIYWWGEQPVKRNFLEGISVGDKLSVLISRRDYLCAMRTVSVPGFPVHYSPAVFRFLTNVAIYALTHGGISDYSGYIPEHRLRNRELPKRAPQVAKIRAVE